MSSCSNLHLKRYLKPSKKKEVGATHLYKVLMSEAYKSRSLPVTVVRKKKGLCIPETYCWAVGEQLCASVFCVWTRRRSLFWKERGVNNWGTQRMCKPKLVGVDWPHSDRLLIDGCQEYGSHWQDESIPQVYEYTWPLSRNNAFPAIGHLSLYSVAALKYFAINIVYSPPQHVSFDSEQEF